LDERIAAGEVLTTLKNIGVNQLIDLNLFDVYQGDNLPEGKRSLALSVTLQDNEKTLEETEINGIMEKLVSTLQSEFDATLRD
ncbi:MAG: phenylalanine--tRNA ligase subunit beta, partial [Pseudomonadota bacterium]|nr:phenylalanine--tRNA ligase subunit beta [Pseudomonadota bacterium]